MAITKHSKQEPGHTAQADIHNLNEKKKLLWNQDEVMLLCDQGDRIAAYLKQE